MRITTAGESHGKGLYCIIEGLPSGLRLNKEKIDAALALRQGGYGRGTRQKLEHDRVEFLSGVRGGVTMGSPVTLCVPNLDYENWKAFLSPEACDFETRRLTAVRPGHADLTGALKFHTEDARNVLERASARETAVRVAAGAVCSQLLEALGIYITGYVRAVGGVSDEGEYSFEQIQNNRSADLRMMIRSEESAKKEIDSCRAAGDTLGGILELRVKGLKSGFGSCMTYREKLDARLCAALMSVQAIKGVEVGLGFRAAALRGSAAHDEIFWDGSTYYRKTNRAGGIEGGMSNGGELILRAAMKPIPTLMRGLRTVDLRTKEQTVAAAERSDVCAIAACETVLEGALACELGAVVSERLGGDTMDELVTRYRELI